MPTSESKEQGLIQFIVAYPSVVYLLISLMSTYLLWQWNDRRKKKKTIHDMEQHAIGQKNVALEKYIHTLAQSLSEAVTQMKGVTDEIKGQIASVRDEIKEEIHSEIHTCSSEIREQIGVLHRRVTEHSEEFKELKGQHTMRVVSSCNCNIAHAPLEDRIDKRTSPGRRRVDQDNYFAEDQDARGGD